MNYLFAALIGLMGGVASGLFGVGGGIVMVPAILFFLKMDIKVAVGTSLAVIVPTAIIGVIKHSQLGNVDWRLALMLAPTAILGGFIGSSLTKIISSANLKSGFGAFLILVGCRLLFFK